MAENTLKTIAGLKCTNFRDARALALPVLDEDDVKIGALIPVGPWVLDDRAIIEDIIIWRQKAMRFFLTQFESSYERTFAYLKNLSIAQEGRIFFLIYDREDDFVGHIGLAGVDGTTGELDNLMRGKSGGHPQLIYFAEKTLLSWAFCDLGLAHMSLRILSFNALTINLHSQFGFDITHKFPLRKSEKDGFTIHEPVEAGDANVRFTSVLMEMTRDGFEGTTGSK